MTNLQNEVTTLVAEVAKAEITTLADNAKLHEVIAKVNELVGMINTKKSPTSSRTMTEADAKDIMIGDKRELSHTKAAEALGLSYGQVYSARKGFTFKPIYKEAVKLGFIKD